MHVWKTVAPAAVLLFWGAAAKADDMERNAQGLKIIQEAVPIFCQSASLVHTGDSYKLSTGAGFEAGAILKKLGTFHIDASGEKTHEITTGVLPENIVAAIQTEGECAEKVLNALAPIFLTTRGGMIDPEAAVKQCDALAASPLDTDRPDNLPGVDIDQVDSLAAETSCRKAVGAEPTPRMQYQLGRALQATHPSESLNYYRLAADRGYAAAQTNAGLDYYAGRGTHKNGPLAIKYLQLAAAQGFQMANAFLGSLYFYGDNLIPQSYEDALPLLQTAATGGDRQSEYELGKMYFDGLGGLDASYSEARRLFKSSASKGFNKSIYMLGWMSENGDGVPASKRTAIDYYIEAEKAGSKQATHALDRLHVN